MEFKNRYHRAAVAYEWAIKNKASHKDAADKFGVTNKQFIANVSSLKNKRPDLYDLILKGELSYNTAYRRYRDQLRTEGK